MKYAFLDNFLTFVMPECDVQVEINFRKIPQYEIDYTYENGYALYDLETGMWYDKIV